jgi:hypothetical protein
MKKINRLIDALPNCLDQVEVAIGIAFILALLAGLA